MKKALALVLALVMALSLTACGNNNSKSEEKGSSSTNATEATQTKEELIKNAKSLTRDDISKSKSNMAYAKSLIGNTYSFSGTVYSIEADYVRILFSMFDDQGFYNEDSNTMVADIYLPTDDLISLESQKGYTFVGEVSDVTHDGVVDFIFKNATLIDDRFERTVTLNYKIEDEENFWDILDSGENYGVFFRDNVDSYKGKEVTISFEITRFGRFTDAYIVE